MASIIDQEMRINVNGIDVISINFPSFLSLKNGIMSVSTYPVLPRIGKDFHSIIAGPVAFDPEFLYCGRAKSSLEGFYKLKNMGIDLDHLSQSLVSSYAYIAYLTSHLVQGALIWGLRHPLISLFELSHLYNQCEKLEVEDLDKFIQELKKKIGKKNAGALKSYYNKLFKGKLNPKELQGINSELHSKISELKVAQRYRQCGYDVVYRGGLIRGGSDLTVMKGHREADVEVRTKFALSKKFPFDINSPFPQTKIYVNDVIDISLSPSEKSNIDEKFNQGNIVVEDLTHDYNLGFKLSARNSFFPNMRANIREVLKKADDIFETGGKPLIMFTSFTGCSEDWAIIDFSDSGSFRV